MRRILVFLLFSLIAFTSCSSLSNMINSELSGLPLWITEPPFRRYRVSFVGQGEGNDEISARENALHDVLDTISISLGRDAYTLYFRELLTNGSISELGGNIDRTYQTRDMDGTYRFYVLLTLDEALYESSISAEYEKMIERENRIRNLLDSATAAYMENRDVAAFSYALDALLVSTEGDVINRNYRSSSLLDLAISYLSPISINASYNRSGGIEIRVRRERGILYPPVINAPIGMTYEKRDMKDEESLGTLHVTTGNDGRYVLSFFNPYMVLGGEISFYLAFDYEKITKIEAALGSDALSSLYNIIDDKSVFLTYDKRPESSCSSVFLIESDIMGNDIYWSSSLDEMNSYFSACRADLAAFKGEGSEEAIVSGYFSSSDDNEVMVIHLSEVSSSYSSSGHMVYVEGTLCVYDWDGNILYEDGNINAVGEGNAHPVALSEAFRQAAINASSLALSII